MSLPLRIEFPGVDCHVTSRGDRREVNYLDDEDCAEQPMIIAHAT